ncbi:MAG: insulinase family protein [Gemmatimonadaceae bacterium]|nr:insulinase family protein [Gemmatimonadaceae bacterium]
MSVRPVSGALRPYAFPPVRRWTLANGMGVAFAALPGAALARVLAVVDGGALADPLTACGAQAFIADAVLEGTATRDADAFVAASEGIGAAFDAGVDWDAAYIGSTMLREHLGAALILLADALRAPRFAGPEMTRLADEHRAARMQAEAEPRTIADERMQALLFPGERAGAPLGGTTAQLDAVRALDLAATHAAHYAPARTTLVVVGDLDAAAVEAQVAAAFGAWEAPTTTGRVPLPQGTSTARRIVVVDRARAAQTELRAGVIGVPRRHPDYLALVVANAILGGLFGSRLNLNLRERNAFTYGARSAIDWRRGATGWTLSTAVQTDVTGAACREMLAEVDALRAAAPSADEVEAATAYLAGVFPIRYETVDAVASALAASVVLDLEADYFDTYRDRVRAIRPADVHRVVRTHLTAEAMVCVAVGDAAAIVPLLERDARVSVVRDA